MRLWCAHQWGKVQEDGFQYCEHCNKAMSPSAKSCDHQWKEKDNYTVSERGIKKQIIYVLKCKNCGEMKNHLVKV